jgi:hypothetical protein
MSNFTHVEDFLEFCTKGYMCLLACNILGIKNIDEDPQHKLPLEKLAKLVVTEVWHEPGDHQELNVVQAQEVPDVDWNVSLTFPNICKCRQGMLSNINTHIS